MPSLIGTAPNQVPVNAMLGSAAYQDVNNFAVETKASSDNSDFAASTKFVQSSFLARQEVLTTTGSSTNYVITPTIPEISYLNGDVWNVKFHTTSGVAPTLSVSGLPGKAIAYQLEDGTIGTGLPTAVLPSGYTSRVRYDSSSDRFLLLDRPLATGSEAAVGLNRLQTLTPYSLRQGLNATGSAPIYACRAWVNFNGTGTVAIRASGNVSSITDVGVGDYTVNFAEAMPDANYSVVGTCNLGVAEGNQGFCVNVHSSNIAGAATTKTTTACRIRISVGNQAGGQDANDISLSFFR